MESNVHDGALQHFSYAMPHALIGKEGCQSRLESNEIADDEWLTLPMRWLDSWISFWLHSIGRCDAERGCKYFGITRTMSGH